MDENNFAEYLVNICGDFLHGTGVIKEDINFFCTTICTMILMWCSQNNQSAMYVSKCCSEVMRIILEESENAEKKEQN